MCAIAARNSAESTSSSHEVDTGRDCEGGGSAGAEAVVDAIHSPICERRLWLGVSVRLCSCVPLSGERDWLLSQLWMASRSYVCPSAATTGSTMTTCVIGQMKADGAASASSTSSCAPGAADARA